MHGDYGEKEVAGVNWHRNERRKKTEENYEAQAVSYRRKYQTTCTLNFNATHIKLYLSCRLAIVSIIPLSYFVCVRLCVGFFFSFFGICLDLLAGVEGPPKYWDLLLLVHRKTMVWNFVKRAEHFGRWLEREIVLFSMIQS